MDVNNDMYRNKRMTFGRLDVWTFGFSTEDRCARLSLVCSVRVIVMSVILVVLMPQYTLANCLGVYALRSKRYK